MGKTQDHRLLKTYKENRYAHILANNTCADYLSPARYAAAAYQSETNQTLAQTTAYVTAPILLSYIAWVLDDAVSRGIKKLFFLARDGYVMKEIAGELSKNKDISLHYLYCSRYVLRQALFIVDPQDALDKCCCTGSYVTAEKVLQRVGLNDDEQKRVLSCIQRDAPYEPLCQAELSGLKQQLQDCELFWEYARKYAKAQLDQLLAYLRQEGIDGADMAVVDCGWFGSMQTGLQKVLSYVDGHKVELTGYYFGIYKRRGLKGTYRCYYFPGTRGLFHATHLNNNLFECLCAADHGITIGYQKASDRIEPIFAPWVNTWDVHLQHSVCRTYARLFADRHEKWHAANSANVLMADQLIYLFMKRPSQKEAIVYGKISFDDDAFENRLIPLAYPLSRAEIKNLFLLRRLYKKVKGLRSPMPFWPEGCLALSEKVPFWANCDRTVQSYLASAKALFLP